MLAGKHAYCRRFTCSIRAEKAEYLTRKQLKVQVVYGDDITKALCQAVDGDAGSQCLLRF